MPPAHLTGNDTDAPMGDDAADRTWLQVNLSYRDWQAAEGTAVNHLRPWLIEAEHDHLLSAWWFMRKGDCWRLRYLPAPGWRAATVNALHELLRGLVAEQTLLVWTPVIYEPETYAFGGPDAMAIAQTLFHADSRHILDHLAQARAEPTQGKSDDHRREAGLFLASTLLRAAGQDWYEQGDIWRQVAAHRTCRPLPTPERDRTVAAVRTLITARTVDPSVVSRPWQAAFEYCGHRLAELAAHGRLTRGLRAVLAHHVLFAWNRAGIPADQ